MTDIHICSFDAVDLLRGKALTYETFKEAVLKAGRFSVFEATANQKSAKLYTQLCQDLEIETDKSLGFPWTLVKKRAVPLCATCRGLERVERLQHVVGRHYKVHWDPCPACADSAEYHEALAALTSAAIVAAVKVPIDDAAVDALPDQKGEGNG
jgi:hypothetical protein